MSKELQPKTKPATYSSISYRRPEDPCKSFPFDLSMSSPSYCKSKKSSENNEDKKSLVDLVNGSFVETGMNDQPGQKEEEKPVSSVALGKRILRSESSDSHSEEHVLKDPQIQSREKDGGAQNPVRNKRFRTESAEIDSHDADLHIEVDAFVQESPNESTCSQISDPELQAKEETVKSVKDDALTRKWFNPMSPSNSFGPFEIEGLDSLNKTKITRFKRATPQNRTNPEKKEETLTVADMNRRNSLLRSPSSNFLSDVVTDPIPKYIIHADSLTQDLWNVLMVFITVWQTVFIPMVLSYHITKGNPVLATTFLSLSFFFDFLCWIDIILRSRCFAVMDLHENEQITSSRTLFAMYSK